MPPPTQQLLALLFQIALARGTLGSAVSADGKEQWVSGVFNAICAQVEEQHGGGINLWAGLWFMSGTMHSAVMSRDWQSESNEEMVKEGKMEFESVGTDSGLRTAAAARRSSTASDHRCGCCGLG
jgi:hypothetical protein